jgi:menaquinone-dependent protoporphyrinogen oxidase
MNRSVLIATASKHGATYDIADEIARVLARRGFDVADKAVDEIGGVDGYDAVIVGSAVYAGRWMSEAADFVKRHADELASRPVWLFSSGPIGDPPQPAGDPQGVSDMVEQTHAHGHQVFAGLLDPDRLGLGEKVIVGMLRAPRGDFRDFPAVAAWAEQIADMLLLGANRKSREAISA